MALERPTKRFRQQPSCSAGEQHSNCTHFCTHFPHSRRPAFCPHQRTPRRAHPIRAGARTGFRCAEQREGDSAVDHRGRMHAESPAIEVDTSLGEFRVRRVLDRIALERRLLEAIVLDNGPFFGRNHLQFASRLRLRAHRPRCAFTTPTRREQASPS